MKKHIAIIDTETNIEQQVFDIGLLIGDTDGKIAFKRGWIAKETFSKQLYYEKHRKLYVNRVKDSKYPLFYAKTAVIFGQIQKILKHYNINEVYAYNAGFDARVIKNLAEEMNLQDPLQNKQINCLWSWSCQSLFQQKAFPQFCLDYGFVSEKGNYQTSAEVAFAYIQKNPNFIEEHTALEDAKIEYQIYLHCRKQKKFKLDGIIANPWILVQPDEQIAKLPKQYRTMQVNLQNQIERGKLLVEKLHKNLEVEVAF